MKEYVLTELGYFTPSDCEKIKERTEGKTFMKFHVSWSVMASVNCTLIISTDYDAPRDEIVGMFLNMALSQLGGK